MKIWVIPINRYITSLDGHRGQYKIKEEFCLIPSQRMNEALDLFYKDSLKNEEEIFNRPVFYIYQGEYLVIFHQKKK